MCSGQLQKPFLIDRLLSAALLALLAAACTPTAPGAGGLPGTGASNDAGSGSSSGCCPALTQTNTTSGTFGNGDLTFAYDSDSCRTTVTATCA